MPRLLLLNGPPGIGKSTLARRYVEDHPLALSLDIDAVRKLIGHWQHHPEESGMLARAMTVEMIRVHLAAGHDVVVPQYVARPDFVELLASTAATVGADFVECLLMDTKEQAIARFHARGMDEQLADHHREMAAMVDGDRELDAMYDRLVPMKGRPRCALVGTRAGDVEGSYQAVLATLGDTPARPARSTAPDRGDRAARR